MEVECYDKQQNYMITCFMFTDPPDNLTAMSHSFKITKKKAELKAQQDTEFV